MEITSGLIIGVALVATVLFTLYLGVKIVPQSEVFVIERFGKYTKTLSSGLSLIVPYLDRVAHRVSVLERRLEEFDVSVITKDNVEVGLSTSVFYRVIDASRSVYRIRNIDGAIYTAAASIVRSAGGKLELDELQSSREAMNAEISKNLGEAAEVWGIEITRTEITDVQIDEQTKNAQRQQLNAERERRAEIARAEGSKKSAELSAEASLYTAQKSAEAVIVKADAESHRVRVEGAAAASVIEIQGKALKSNEKIIELEKARSWDGVLPTTNVGGDSGANFLFELKSSKSKK